MSRKMFDDFNKKIEIFEKNAESQRQIEIYENL